MRGWQSEIGSHSGSRLRLRLHKKSGARPAEWWLNGPLYPFGDIMLSFYYYVRPSVRVYICYSRVPSKAPLLMMKLLPPVFLFFWQFFLLCVTFDHPKIIWMLSYIAQRKGFDALNAMQKTAALCKVPFLKKSRKTGSKWSFLTIWTIFDHFELVFLNFFRNGTLQRAEIFLCCIQCIKPLLLSYLNQDSDNFSDFSS